MPSATGVYGVPPRDLATVPDAAIQFSPLIPDAAALEDVADSSLASLTMLAPPGTIERQFALAQALRVLEPGGALVALAPNKKGGTRLAKELAAFGCDVQTASRSHHRICTTTKPAEPIGIDAAIAAGLPQMVEKTRLWSQPGIFSWDRIDPGSALLAAHLPELAGAGADFGCGNGYLALTILKSARVKSLALIDLDRRAVAAAKRNVTDARATFTWADARTADLPQNLDFVVMNPPFHDGGAEDRALGKTFITRAASALRKSGTCWLVANRHLPYEETLNQTFSSICQVAAQDGFKIYEAVK